MSGPIVLALRLITAIALYGFLGWALFLLWREVQRQGFSLANRRVPGISFTVRHGRATPLIKHFTQPEITLGRDPGCDIPLVDDTVSTRHAQLTYHHGQWWLEDLASTNGTILNETTVSMPTVITSGDEIKCGATQLIVNLSKNVFIEPTQRRKKKMTEKTSIAIIGGSGLYDMAGLQDTQEHDIDTPFGKPSAPITVGTLEGTRVAFLARHGIGHHITPTEVPYRANIYALKLLGVERVISISACGSLREDYAPGHIVIPDNIFDYTKDRTRSFFGEGMVAHISVADPFCNDLSNQVEEAVRATSATTHRGGSLITIEGPRFSTKAESNTFRTWGMSIIGMTASPEAFLAREAELCYATMAHVTDYDVWHESESPVTVEMVIQTLHKNTNIAQEAIRNLVRGFKTRRDCNCGDALSSALITNPKIIPAETRKNLDLLVGKYLK